MTQIIQGNFRDMNKITDQIYVGCYHAASMLDYSNREGITHILNCTPDPHQGLKDFTVNQLNIHDGYEIPAEIIGFAIKCISEAVKDGGKILVHCHAGISRSTSLVCAYLMSCGFSWDDAVALVKAHRPQVWPHPNVERSIKNYFGKTINPNTTLLRN